MTDEDKIRNFVLKRAGKRGSVSLDGSTRLFEKSLLDSMGILELMAFVEDEFRLHFKKGEFKPENFSTINRILRLIRLKRRIGKPA